MVLNKLVKEQLKSIRDSLRYMGQFTDDEHVKILKSSQEIDAAILVSNHQAKAYKALREKQGTTLDTLGLATAIQFENLQILNNKFKVVQFFHEDLYKRIETLGKQVVRLTQVVEQLEEH
ncbi:MAG: hypothetical protein AB7F28_06115 [Candidatus Margulisiibacteriota bacterium]